MFVVADVAAVVAVCCLWLAVVIGGRRCSSLWVYAALVNCVVACRLLLGAIC